MWDTALEGSRTVGLMAKQFVPWLSPVPGALLQGGNLDVMHFENKAQKANKKFSVTVISQL